MDYTQVSSRLNLAQKCLFREPNSDFFVIKHAITNKESDRETVN